jgi:phosphoglycerate dehydrogenase-like enzyme
MSQRIRLLITENASSRFVAHLHEARAEEQFHLLIPQEGSEAELCALAPEADAALCYQGQLSRAIIDAAHGLRFIQKHGRNCRNIDVAAAAQRNIPVATLPLMRTVTVAEHALALMLTCARKIIPAHHAVVSAAYRTTGLTPIATTQRNYRSNWAGIQGMTELFGATVGIVGMGDIGMEIARRCRAFDMKICYFQRTRHDEATERAFGMRYAPLDGLLAESDFIVLVLPHTPDTEGIICDKTLAYVKPTAILINIGRGGLIDEAALIDALRSDRIAMAGLDVYRNEPLPANSPLLTLPNAVLLPHTGGGSARSWDIDMPAVLSNIKRFFATGEADGVLSV